MVTSPPPPPPPPLLIKNNGSSPTDIITYGLLYFWKYWKLGVIKRGFLFSCLFLYAYSLHLFSMNRRWARFQIQYLTLDTWPGSCAVMIEIIMLVNKTKGSIIFYHQGGSWNLGGTHEFWKSKRGNRRIFGRSYSKKLESQNINLY